MKYNVVIILGVLPDHIHNMLALRLEAYTLSKYKNKTIVGHNVEAISYRAVEYNMKVQLRKLGWKTLW